MQGITETLIKLKDNLKASGMILQKEQESSPFKCGICKDVGFVFKNIDGYETASKCKCKIKEEMLRKSSNSGLEELFNIRTFGAYNAVEPFQRAMKNMAIDYTKEFIKGNRQSIAMLGQPGAGKTHLLIAVTKKLIDNNVEVKYYVAQEIIQRLNACKFDEENYNREFSKIANCEVLFIDDLFKSDINNYYQVESIDQEALRPIFQIINYRYNKNKPILINSEIHFERFSQIDQALLGRINEMCNYKYLTSVKPDSEKNYRLKRR